MWEKLDDGEFALVKIYVDDNGSDILTKNLSMDRLRVGRQRTRLAYSFPQAYSVQKEPTIKDKEESK